MIKKTTFLGLVISTLFFSACGDESTSTPSVTAIVQVDNKTTTNMYQLYIKNSDTSSWGRDLLASSTYIQGQTKVNFETSKCDRLVDIKVAGFLGSPLYIGEQMQVNCGSTFIFKIVN